LETEQQRHGETAKSMRRQERRLKELTTQLDEDRTTHERMHDVIDKLHQKLKTYKRQIDDAVCIIAVGLVVKVLVVVLVAVVVVVE